MDNLLERSIKDIIDKYDPIFFNKSNVTGIGFGNKRIKGINTKEPCLHVMVQKKLPSNKLYKHQLIPKNFLGIKTDVIETGKFSFCGTPPPLPSSPPAVSSGPPPIPSTPPATSSGPPPIPSMPPSTSNNYSFLSNRAKKRAHLELLLKLQSELRPLIPGAAILPITKKGGFGTLGGFVFDNNTNVPYILSNNHVLCDYNTLAPKTPIVQPPVEHYGTYTPNDIIAYLTKGLFLTTSSMENIFFNKADAAIAEISSNIEFKNMFLRIGNPLGITEPKVDMIVKKIGAGSGYSEGIIISTHCKELIDFKGIYNCYFHNQINADLNTTDGDSGSLVLNADNKVVGLFYSSSDNIASFSPIQYILNFFNVHFKTP
ncbi:trypsin-like peptidase domain-containing protein [Clostridium tarantellae]|uniref:Peptidase S7 domain-containing protein n=1 Tax=Clostridium tarantellae TaxID=39493 RepID=A0A6I1MIK9_9CLOT|nr:trypsin-like peptidase domain-containing protein [Clostridium tarantellae]MPQ42960.1 hypothetical protein [Clostridium tarantellae]